MSDSAAKDKEKQSSYSTPPLTETESDELPIETVLAILYSMAKRLEKENAAAILTGRSPKGETVTYIRMPGIDVDITKGFVLAVPTQESHE